MANKSKYSELLRDPRWQKKRLEILEYDNWLCRMCGDSESPLNVHHIKYVNGRAPWEYENLHLISLCEDCHEREYGYRSECEKKLLEILKDKGFLGEDVEFLADIIAGLLFSQSNHPLVSLLELKKYCNERVF